LNLIWDWYHLGWVCKQFGVENAKVGGVVSFPLPNTTAQCAPILGGWTGGQADAWAQDGFSRVSLCVRLFDNTLAT